jgi:hypothetical protein
MATLAEKVSVGVLLAVGVAYAVVPSRVSRIISPGTSLIVDGILWADATLPRPLFLSIVFLVTTVVSILIAISVGRVLYTLLKLGGPRTKRAYEFVMPGTPIGKVVVGMGLITAFLFGSVWGLPYLLGELDGGSSEDLVDNQAQALSVLNGDTTTAGGGDALADVNAYDRPSPDADGDRLRDGWERADETQDGVALSDADPDRMDLYVQVNYGGGTYPLSETEKEQLRRVWREMPVENPDGSTGIAVHIVDSPPRGGGLGTQVSVNGSESAEIHQYYTDRYLGQRACRYHQVVIGDVRESGTAGVADSPGFASVVEDNRSGYDGNVSKRVHVITHELLHNVAAPVGHTEDGWLTPSTDPAEEHLSDTTARYIEENGFAGSGYYQRNLC